MQIRETVRTAPHCTAQAEHARDVDPGAAAWPPVPVHAAHSREQLRPPRLRRRRLPHALHRIPHRHPGTRLYL